LAEYSIEKCGMARLLHLTLSMRRIAAHGAGDAIIDMDCVALGEERKNPDAEI
jgi:hypothetical protein